MTGRSNKLEAVNYLSLYQRMAANNLQERARVQDGVRRGENTRPWERFQIMKYNHEDVVLPPEFKVEVKMVKIKKFRINVPVLNHLTDTAWEKIITASLIPFYMYEYTHQRHHSMDLFRGLTSTFASIDDSFTAELASEAICCFNQEIEYIPTRTEESYVAAFNQESNHVYNQVRAGLIRDGMTTLDAALVLWGVCMLSIGYDGTEWYDSWFLNKLRAFAPICGQVDVHELRRIKPNMQAMEKSYQNLKAVSDFRKHLVLMLLKHKQSSSMFGRVCAVVAEELKYFEMSHILIIDRYLMGTLPELMNTRLMSPYKTTFDEMVKFMYENREILPYVKLLKTDAETAVMDDEPFMHCAAACVARKMDKSFIDCKDILQGTIFATNINILIAEYMSTGTMSELY